MSSRLDSFAKAVDRLDQALDLPASDVVRDACIQRFEFSFELGTVDIHASQIRMDAAATNAS